MDDGFDRDPGSDSDERQEGEEADDADPGSKLKGENGERAGEQQIGKQRPACRGGRRDATRAAHQPSPARR